MAPSNRWNGRGTGRNSHPSSARKSWERPDKTRPEVALILKAHRLTKFPRILQKNRHENAGSSCSIHRIRFDRLFDDPGQRFLQGPRR